LFTTLLVSAILSVIVPAFFHAVTHSSIAFHSHFVSFTTSFPLSKNDTACLINFTLPIFYLILFNKSPSSSSVGSMVLVVGTLVGRLGSMFGSMFAVSTDGTHGTHGTTHGTTGSIGFIIASISISLVNIALIISLLLICCLPSGHTHNHINVCKFLFKYSNCSSFSNSDNELN
jgi:hypothetical protein